MKVIHLHGGRVYHREPCGCELVLAVTLTSEGPRPSGIFTFCPGHTAAQALLEAVRDGCRTFAELAAVLAGAEKAFAAAVAAASNAQQTHLEALAEATGMKATVIT